MTRKLTSPHVVASQALYAARLALDPERADYEAEVYRQLDRLKRGLTEHELARVRLELAVRLAAAGSSLQRA